MKHGYRYFQRGEKLPWIALPAENAEQEALAQGAVRLTVLSTSKVLGIEGDVAPRDVRFFGPLYFDIDHKGDLGLAIASANQLITRLQEEYGVAPEDIDVFLSGSKGLHVFLPPSSFGLERAVMRLPAIFKEMALRLYVSGMDLQPYSLRNAFRLPNVKRDDGRFRVQVSIDELRTLTVERYQELVKEPRYGLVLPEKTGTTYTQLTVLFEQAAEVAKRNEKPITNDSSTVMEAVLRQNFSVEAPPCMQHFAEGKRAEQANFNQVAQQVAVFAARLGPDGMGAFEPVFQRIADNQTSGQYERPRQRLEHMEGLYNYMRHTPRFVFSCNAVRSVVKTRVCEDCPLEAVKIVDSPESAAEAVGLQVRADGYFDSTTPNKPRRISTFVLEPQYVFHEVTEDGQQRRVGTYTSVQTNGNEVGKVLIDENAWANRQSFLRALSGYSNLSFLGSDTDIQKIKYVTMADSDLPEKLIVRECGLHVNRINDKEVRTYVETGRSINSLKIRDTMAFEGNGLYAPFLLSTPRVQEGDQEAQQALLHLLQMNEPLVIGGLVGWAVACHLKPHLMHLYRQFPPVNLWGPMSAGKTTTAACALMIGGVDFLSEHEVMNVPNSTPYAWLESLSNSNSVPVIWDELNKSAERMPPKQFAKACELLKATFNGQAAHKGALSSRGTNPTVVSYKMVRPVVFCSEQQPDVSALNDRAINLFITKKGKNGKRAEFFSFCNKLPGIKRLASTLMLTALTTPTSAVSELYLQADQALPEDLSERPRYGLAVACAGLIWLEKVLGQVGMLEPALQERLQTLLRAVRDHAKSLAAEESSREVSTEVDRVFGDIFEIVAQGMLVEQGLIASSLLMPGVHFAFKTVGGLSLLYLDLRACHTAYMRWARSKGSSVVLDDLRNFITLAKTEDYVKGVVQTADVLEGKHAFMIDLVSARRRGLPVDQLGTQIHDDF